MRTYVWSERLLRAKRIARRNPNVVGVDYGYASKNGRPLKTLAIRFHVREKKDPAELSPKEMLPKEIDDVRCDVIEFSYSLHATAHDECTPLQPGLSVGNVDRGKSGSLGLFVKIAGDAGTYLLSNWHVLCGSLNAQKNDRICQPGPADAASHPARIVGTPAKWTSLASGIDAAIALLDPPIATSATLFGSTVPVAAFEDPRPDMKLIKSGAYSGLTHGIVDGIEGAFEMNYTGYGDQVRWMDAIRIRRDDTFPETEISIRGDSGAIWVNAANGKAVALHFGGEDELGPTEEYALAHPIGRVLELLGVNLA